ncbi:Endoplasmic reticulum zinc transporter [Coccidioides posadasii str. Silveira]|uniref:Zinc transporter n=3 Tax=Coccidioides posadasii TaxID=199306 RepID=E9CV27_COCPS|nr:cation transport protein, putative [Coccidioides posadasii C735 delta SOWgp]EER24866.1 cation transport protein, putative [Coccidioides posadasii C735 delta SOWgp]EFW21218.1 cation efflux protein [Coccidioides posadasii str. Silveira]KMM71625.1 cation efflux family protein family [Coccidioides posadasii RMSCC 3488]QVM12814.1 Endoplasmic reticulum zinc transporter [Coccidioides posadasii str. Silveira]|eukprot:XP_003067011.1 cation transport protein, putative [Coccidioides posadasii C735 delta SOWgp]
MASNPSIPVPPRTPTPPSDEPATANSVGSSLATPMTASFSRDALSPMVDTFPSGDPAWNPQRRASQDISGPFNFKPTALAKTPVVKSGVGQRRGHKYKHSSVSHQIFLEPPPRAPLALPNSLPIPTLKECRGSMSKEQKVRFWWSLCHMAVAGNTLWSAHGSMAMTGLSHLLLFDSLGAMLCVAVDVLGNFEVWRRSTVRHPFGLERAEVVAGFALSVLLFFMGGDLISHAITHLLETSGSGSHRPHSHGRVSSGSIDITALLALLATIISAIGLKNHARIGKAMRFAYIESLPSLLSNPAHFLTLSCSSLLLLLPLLSVTIYTWMDRAFALAVAMSMCALGIRLVATLGSMLLMSYSGRGVSSLMKDIASHPSVSGVEEAKFWQVHYGLCMANLKLRVAGPEDSLTKLRERISSMIKERLGGGYGSGGQKWEVSIQLNVEQL